MSANKEMLAKLKGKSNNKDLKGRPPIYSDEEVNAVMKSLDQNNGNIAKTAQQTGVNGKTIKIWRNRRMLEARYIMLTREREAETKGITIEQLRENYEREVINSKSSLLKLIMENLTDCKSPRILLTALVKISETIQTPGTAATPKTPPVPPREGSIMAVVANQAVINNNNGPKDNRAGGDSEEPAG
jgi:transposase-like protein